MAAETAITAYQYVPAIVALPATAFVVALLVGRYLPWRGAAAGAIATAGSLVFSLWTLLTVANVTGGTAPTAYHSTIWTWASGVNTFDLHFGIYVDPLSSLLLVIVSLVSLLVFVFSYGYMNEEGETGLARYYSELSLFSFSMLAFVVADNLLMAFVFFELVGFCSYLLIGFWFRERAPPSAAKKAFLVTRFGDFFLLVGVVGVFGTFGTGLFAGGSSFPHLAELALAGEETVPTFGFGTQAWFAILGLLMLGGAIGKSAQFPLHTWLPDAMEGPTPISALIHAATMVAAGVYLLARMYGFYALLPTVLAAIALVGGFTALFAATMGAVKREIKQVLAYSTISQYGYVMLALGSGGYVAAMFHLTTHAVFKALLFLGAGSVLIAMHHNENMWDMGGLRERMPVTYWTFLSGSLALAGIFPFAGFWSKDEVLYDALVHGLDDPVILLAWLFGLLAVFVTGFYTFRMVLLTFHGEPRTDEAEDPEPVGWSVKVPLVILGVLAAIVGFVNMGPVAAAVNPNLAYFQTWLDGSTLVQTQFLTGAGTYEELLPYSAGAIAGGEVGTMLLSAAVSLALALAGAGLAYWLYSGPEPEEHTQSLGGLQTLAVHNYYQDEYQVWLAQGVTVPVARALDRFDQGVVDGVVDGISSVSLFSGSRVRRVQTGVVSNYAAFLTLGLVALLVAFGLYGGWF
ncbi:MAG: NADH-quinone oxidoreductase subunit L [Haloarculaceae archaeon]